MVAQACAGSVQTTLLAGVWKSKEFQLKVVDSVQERKAEEKGKKTRTENEEVCT